MSHPTYDQIDRTARTGEISQELAGHLKACGWCSRLFSWRRVEIAAGIEENMHLTLEQMDGLIEATLQGKTRQGLRALGNAVANHFRSCTFCRNYRQLRVMELRRPPS